MSTYFEISYQLRTNELAVSYNGADQLKNSFSPFTGFRGQPFARWFTDLPQACFDVSGTQSYTVGFRGEPLCTQILEVVLGGRMKALPAAASLIGLKHRLVWARELGAATGRTLNLQPLRALRQPASGLKCDRITLCDGSSVSVTEVQSGDRADVLFVDSEAAFDAMAKQLQCADRLRLFVRPGSAWKMEKVAPGCCLAQCPPAELADRLARWYEEMNLSTQLAVYQGALLGAKLTALQEEKRQRLTQDKPYLHMTLPARVKVGEAFEMPRVTKLPEDMKAAVLPDPRYVDVQKRNGAYWFVPKLEGRFAFVVEPASCPGERKSFGMEAYQLHPVTSIRLTTSVQRVMPGDSFTVSASYAPSNADNTARARWVISSGASCVRMIAPGQFTAASAGRCTITHEVEGVQASVSIDVLPAATGLKLSTHQITVKVSDASRQLGVIVDPPGAQGYSVTYSVKDGSVLRVDPRNGQITPVAEGHTTIDVCLLDSHGMLVRSDSCAVEVLPLHQVVNPDIITIIAIVLVLLEGFFAPSTLATVVMIAAIGTAAAGVWRNKVLLVKVINIVAIVLAVLIQFI